MKDKDYDVIAMGPIKAIPQGEFFTRENIYFSLGFTSWDKIEVQGPQTLEQIFAQIKEKHGVNLSLVEMLGALIYSTGMTPKES